MSSRKTNHRQPRENELPTTPVESTVRHVTNTGRAATTTKPSRNDRQPSSFLTNPKRRKYPSSLDWDSQITLTQLVPKAEAEASDPASGLVEYEHHGTEGRSAEVIDLVDDTEKYDESWTPSTSRRPAAKRQSTGGSRSPNSIPTTTFKRRKSSVLISGGPKASKLTRGKNNKGSGRNGTDRNKTLTQMDFVRRFIPLPDSDDEDLREIAESKEETLKDELVDLTPRKRRKLNDQDVAPSPTIKSKVSPDEKKPPILSIPSAQPKTPQKERRFEIPSSQTPETPQQAFAPSPSIRRVSRFSLEGPLSNTTQGDRPKSPLQGASEEVRDQHMRTDEPKPQDFDFADDDIVASTIIPCSQLLQRSTENETTISESDPVQPTLQPPEPPPLSSAPKRTIVYDTDEETDYGDLEDDNLPEISIGAKALEEWAEPIDGSLRDPTTKNCDYSDDLPPIPNSGTDLEITGNILSDTMLPSESSVYYRRPAQYTQYPNEPVPMMNTQKIAELFPVIEENDYPASTMQPSIPSTREPAASVPHGHSDALGSEMETPTQDDSVNRSIQVVPESSPITRSYDTARLTPNTMAPPTRESIVLVESSQLVDRLNRQNESMDTGKSLRRLFSTRDFLTDSVMESIPAPPWMASQDSIGEPYPENEDHGRSG
uniref:Neurogenic locus notch like protein 3 n=1 Tax=Talaromyces marneffei PM1 TaxID=1077442 RepID=A0A093XG34_TALMA